MAIGLIILNAAALTALCVVIQPSGEWLMPWFMFVAAEGFLAGAIIARLVP